MLKPDKERGIIDKILGKEEIDKLFAKLLAVTKEQDIINLTIRGLINDSKDPRWLPIHMIDVCNAIILNIAGGEGKRISRGYFIEKLDKLNEYSRRMGWNKWKWED